MKPTMTIAALAAITTVAHAGPPAAPVPKPAERQLFTWDVQDRVRWEIKDNAFDFNDGVRTINDDNWVLNRFRLGVGVQPTDWLKVYAQVQDAREWLSDRADIPGVFGADGDDSFDLRQAYVELAVNEWGLKLGRQVLQYGDDRLIGPGDWGNLGNVFDAVKLTYKGQGWSIDAFASTRVTQARGHFNQSDLFNGNETHREQVFSGLYFSTKALSFADTDVYALHLHQAGNTDFFTLGTRLKSKPAAPAPMQHDGKSMKHDGKTVCPPPAAANPWDWDAEFAFQFGEVGGRDLSAFAGHVGLGYTIPGCPINSRIGLEYNYATGDGDPTDGDVETFQNLFPSNHKFYGFMDAFSWQNIHDVAVSWKAKPCTNVTARLDYHAFWLADTNDVWYRANGTTAVRPLSPAARNASSYAGSELDLIVTWQARKELAIEAGYSHFFAGSYLGDTGAQDDANFGYVQATISF
jgi:hypothetical protein